jgi:uncharacterized phage-associated protein
MLMVDFLLISIYILVNKEKTQLAEPVISFLYTQYCDYKSETINETDIQMTFFKILNYVFEEQTNKELSDFVLNTPNVKSNLG